MLPFLVLFFVISCINAKVDISRSIVWGPGLKPEYLVLPARYFFVQLVDTTGRNLTRAQKGELDVFIGSADKSKGCRVWSNILNRNDGSFIVRYKVYESCDFLIIDLRYENQPLPGFPLYPKQQVLPDECNCPKSLDVWRKNMDCHEKYDQIEEDLKPFEKVDMDNIRKTILNKFNKRGSMSICHYVIVDNEIHRFCHGQYVGFHVFMDAILLSLARKVKLPSIEFFVNLGDWPLERIGPDPPLPMFSWCGSKDTADIVMPTYDLTESTLEAMGRVQLDMLSVQGNTGPTWDKKKPVAFFRGRDSSRERLDLVDISRKNPHLFNVSLTNFFFFRDLEDQYGPKQPHESFFNFFQFKYQINMDGTVAAYRFPYLLAGDSLVLKQDSSFYEFFYRDLKAGQHYLKFKRDVSDLVSQIEWALANDKEAKKIGRQGTHYARENLLPTNVFCYHAVLLEEWSKRLVSKVEVLPMMEHVPQPATSDPCNCGSRHDEL